MKNNILASIRNRTSPTPPMPVSQRWIYWNQALWLISFTSDRYLERWTTIADKDLWATQVWQTWLFYQWWNCHWFSPSSFQTTEIQVDATNYGPYWYSEEYFVWNQWMETLNTNLWWWVTWTIRAKRWPCAEWFHIPSKDEVQALLTWLSDFVWLNTTAENVMRYLKWVNYPVTYTARWERVNNLYGCDYWLADAHIDPFDSNMIYGNQFLINVRSNSVSLGGGVSSGAMLPIRPFKDEGEVPQANQWRQIIYDSWDGKYIQRNPDRWIISVPVSPTQFITIADKNLWATQVWNYWDVVTTANGWWMFQRWNCYMFPFEWDITARTNTRKSVANYWPYYYWEEFILESWDYDLDWTTVVNNNLWWWEVWTVEATRWPCPEWFHIPSNTEMSNLIDEMVRLWMVNDWWSQSIWTYMNEYLKMPQTWRLRWDWYYSISDFMYYMNNAIWWHQRWPYMLWREPGHPLWITNWQIRCDACAIRPFKNEPVAPDSTRTQLFTY